jgi:general secretion pathway protein A
MYTSFFGLNEKPFAITPDPRYLFMSERHGEALAHLVYGVTESGGFIQLTGEVGTGKTTLVRTLLQNRLPENADVAVVLNPRLSTLEFLETICEELGILRPEYKGSIKALVDALNKQLLHAYAEGRRVILVVDEAQNLSRDVLEQVRLLTNLETSKQKLLQIILIGQPELRDLLSRDDLRQLAQRITGRYHLEPLTRDETAQYIEHRLRVAGALGEVFDNGAKREVFRLTDGVPRLINVICDRALLGAYSRELRRVNRRLIRRAAAEIKGIPYAVPWLRWALPVIAAVAVVIIGASFWSLLDADRPLLVERPAPSADTQQDESSEPPIEEISVVAKPVPEPAPEPDPTLDEQLILADGLTRLDTAFTELFEIWGLEYSGGDGCVQARNTGHACLINRGSWSSLRQLDRPAILTLTDSRGDSHHVVLTALLGEVWLRQSLASIDERYRADPLDSNVFDSALEQRVREFQRDHRLDVDGLVGRQTQIIINSLLAPDGTPRLTTPRLARD